MSTICERYKAIVDELKTYQRGDTAAQSGGKVLVSLVESVVVGVHYTFSVLDRSAGIDEFILALTLLVHEQGDDESIDTQDTSHDNWDDWFENEFWFEYTHWCDTDTGFGSSVSCPQVYIQTKY